MKRFWQTVGKKLAAMASMIVSTATFGLNGEIEPPACLKK